MNSFSIPASADNRFWTPLTDSELVRALLHEHVRLPRYQQLLESLLLRPGMNVLEYGSGAGEVAGLLASQEGLDVHAFDPVEAMQQATRQLVADYCKEQIPIYGTTDEIPNNHFDVVVSYLVACILDDPALQTMLSAVREKMKGAGIFQMVICNPNIAACERTAIDRRFPEGLDLERPCLLPKMKLSGAQRTSKRSAGFNWKNALKELAGIGKTGSDWEPYGVHERHRPEPWWDEALSRAGFRITRRYTSPYYSLSGNAPSQYRGRVIPGDYLAFECTMT